MKHKNKMLPKIEQKAESKEMFSEPAKEAAAKKLGPVMGGKDQMPDVDDGSVDPDEVDELLKKKPKSIADLKKIINAKAMKGKI
jgi:hypothetical protein